MPSSVKYVTRPLRDPRIPDVLGPAVALLHQLVSEGLLADAGAVFRMGRRGGFTGVPIVSFVLVYLCCGKGWGIRPFWTEFKAPLRRVAAVARCVRFPSSGSLSRALVRMDMSMVKAFTDATLTHVPCLDRLLRHSAAAHIDRHGAAWHVLDLDPTIKAFRQRGLVEGEAYPEPVRLAPGVRGYTGKKRGEIRIRSVPVCHAGTGLWLSYRLWPGNQHLSMETVEVVEQAVAVMEGADIPRGWCILRADNEFGSAGVARRIVELGLHMVTRLSRYKLLARPEIIEAMRAATWQPVRTGEKGPREAADLGLVTLHAAPDSADAGIEPVAMRVVLARYRCTHRPNHGVKRGDLVYEMFGTTLPTDHFTAADIVELYGGRAVIENRFAQEDRELDLGRTFSFNPAGQAFVTAIGLFLWNYQTTRGFQANPPPEKKLGIEVGAPPLGMLEQAREQSRAVAGSTLHEAAESPSVDEVGSPRPPQVTDELAPPGPFPDANSEELQTVSQVLHNAFANVLERPGWTLVADQSLLRCPNQRRLFPFSVSPPKPGRSRARLHLRTDIGACDSCPLRVTCFSSHRANTYKTITKNLTPEQTAYVTGFLRRHPPTRTRAVRAKTRPDTKPVSSPKTRSPKPLPPLFSSMPPQRPVGLCTPRTPGLLPGAMRQAARKGFGVSYVEIRLGRPNNPDSSRPHPFLADEPDAARRSRMTWSKRDDRWRTNRDVHITYGVPPGRPRTEKTPG